MRNLVKEFTKDEKARLIDMCDFTDSELELFKLRRNDISLELCAEEMNISTKTAVRINKTMQNKILRVEKSLLM